MNKFLIIIHDAANPTPKDRNTLKEHICNLFEADINIVEELFAELPAVLDRNLEESCALALAAKLRRIGAIVEIQPDNEQEADSQYTRLQSTESTSDSVQEQPLVLDINNNDTFSDNADLDSSALLELTNQLDSLILEENDLVDTTNSDPKSSINFADLDANLEDLSNLLDQEISSETKKPDNESSQFDTDIGLSLDPPPSSPSSQPNNLPTALDADNVAKLNQDSKTNHEPTQDTDLNNNCEDAATKKNSKETESQILIQAFAPNRTKRKPTETEVIKETVENSLANEFPSSIDSVSNFISQNKRAVFGLGILCVILIGYIFLSSFNRETSDTLPDNSTPLIDTLLANQKNISSSHDSLPSVTHQLHPLMSWKAVAELGKASLIINIRSQNNQIVHLDFRTLAETPKLLSPEEFVQGTANPLWLKRFECQKSKSKLYFVPERNNAFEFLTAAPAYIGDGASTGRVIAKLRFTGTIDESSKTLEGELQIVGGYGKHEHFSEQGIFKNTSFNYQIFFSVPIKAQMTAKNQK